MLQSIEDGQNVCNRGVELHICITFAFELPRGEGSAIDPKRAMAPTPERGFHSAWEDLKPRRRFVVYPGEERFALGDGVEAIGVVGLAKELQAAG
jgi:hypothetical protein